MFIKKNKQTNKQTNKSNKQTKKKPRWLLWSNCVILGASEKWYDVVDYRYFENGNKQYKGIILSDKINTTCMGSFWSISQT